MLRPDCTRLTAGKNLPGRNCPCGEGLRGLAAELREREVQEGSSSGRAKKNTTPYGVILECDELWSFVGKRLNKQWIWLAMDRLTRRIVGVHVGDRTERSAQALWDSIPAQYQTSAPVYTDFWSAYARIIPAHRHYPSAKIPSFPSSRGSVIGLVGT
ncbi:MAG: IS1 family transposase, partial [Marichromatium sp.]|nr:IS1 family transposase [Marichromatium sp.]